MLAAAPAPVRVAGPLVFGDYGEGEGWYQEITEIVWDPVSGLGAPFSLKKVFKKVTSAVKKVVKPIAKVATYILPPVTIAAATGVLGSDLKKTAKKVGHLVGGAMRVAAPFAGFIPGVGPLAAAGLAAGGTVLGRMLQRDKPLQVFGQAKTLYQAGGAALSGYATAGIQSGSLWPFSPAAEAAPAVPTAEILRGTSGYATGAVAAAEGPTFGSILGSVGRLATTGLAVYSQVAGQEPATGAEEEVVATPYGPEYLYPSQPYLTTSGPADPFLSDFPGIIQGGVEGDGGGIVEEAAGAPPGILAAGMGTPLLVGGGLLLLLLMRR